MSEFIVARGKEVELEHTRNMNRVEWAVCRNGGPDGFQIDEKTAAQFFAERLQIDAAKVDKDIDVIR